MSRFNKPLGMRLEHFTPEARLVLRLGHKFALERKLRASLLVLAQDTHDAFQKKFNALSNQEEKDGLKAWLTAISRDINIVEEPRLKKLDLLVAKGIRDLRKLPVILKQADKNLGLVPIHRHVYEMMVRDHLGDTTKYRRVSLFPCDGIFLKMQQIMEHAPFPSWKRKRLLNEAKQRKEPAPFYVIPKIHKKKLHASRPIAAQHSYMLASLSKELSDVLLREVRKIDVISKDSKTTALELDEFKFDRDGIFLTYDIVAMYPNIDLRDAIDILERNVASLRENHYFWGRVLQLVMNNCYVKFNEETYRQIAGTAMGTPVAPPFANLYFYFKYIEVLKDKAILFQRRFIDDGFVIIETRSAAEKLMQRMSAIGSLEFTYEISESKALYLDFEIYRGQRYAMEKRLDFRPFFKPTNKFLYLPDKSNHPRAMKMAIVKGEAIRCLRNSSCKSEWLRAMHLIFKGLIARGYDGKEIKERFKQVRWEQREAYLRSTGSQSKKPEGTIALTHFHRLLRPSWRKLIDKHKLTKRLRLRRRSYNKQQQEVVDAWPPVVVFKDFHKIGHRVIHARQDSRYAGVTQCVPTPNATT